MPRLEIYGPSARGLSAWDKFDEYVVTTRTDSLWRMVYDTRVEGELRTDRQAQSISFVLDDGAITAVRYFNERGALMAEMTGLRFDAALAASFFHPDEDDGDSVFGMMIAPGLTVLGGQTADDDWEARDEVLTGIGRDTVTARSGRDTIRDIGGADSYDGGSGPDTLAYDGWFTTAPERVRQGIDADLQAGRITGPDGKVDRVAGIEALRGTFLADRMLGDGADNSFQGQQGADIFDGRGGIDTVDYGKDTDRGGQGDVHVNLFRGFATDGWGNRDRLRSIENVLGSDGADRLIDNGRANTLEGDDGGDVLVASGGNDVLEGGFGADRFVFSGQSFGTDTITDFNPAFGDRILIREADSLSDLDIDREGLNTLIRLDADSVVVLADHTGQVTSFLLFD